MFGSRFKVTLFPLFLLCSLGYDVTKILLATTNNIAKLSWKDAVVDTNLGYLQKISTLLDQKKYREAYQYLLFRLQQPHQSKVVFNA